jgi:hypothetical protein
VRHDITETINQAVSREAGVQVSHERLVFLLRSLSKKKKTWARLSSTDKYTPLFKIMLFPLSGMGEKIKHFGGGTEKRKHHMYRKIRYFYCNFS